MALQHNLRRIIIYPTLNIATTLDDWLTLINNISQRPISVHELVPGDPEYLVFSDMLALSARVVCTSGTQQFYPIVWEVLFPEEVCNRLLSEKIDKDTLQTQI